VLLDEWQAVPGVFGAARRAVDAEPRPNRFLLTGSVKAELDHEVWRGFPDAALLLSGRARRMWLQSYLADLLTHDIEELENPVTKRRDSERLRRYFEAYALHSAGVADHKTIFDAAGVARDTAAAYELLLMRLLVVDQLPAWTSNRLRRLVRSPKRYVVDAALITAALSLSAQAVLGDGDMLGRMLDTFVVAQLRPETVVSDSEPRLHHLRTEGGRHEVDVLAELGGGRVIGIEVKAAAAPTVADARHLRWLQEELGDRFAVGVVLHTGPRVYELAQGVVGAPISTLWG
jgi:predicted AAA+ superfamily ATPase